MKKQKRDRRIYCKYCGTVLRGDADGWWCPKRNCCWWSGVPESEMYSEVQS